MQPAIPAMIAITFLLGACVPENTDTKPAEPPAETASDTCGAAQYQTLVGQKSPVINLPADKPHRKLTEGAPMTLDYRMDRVNFEFDKSGKLVRVFCG